MKTSTLYSILLLSLAFSGQALSAYAADLSVNRYYVGADGYVYFGTTTQPSSTCSNWGEYFKFNGSTAGGKNMLATLVTAKIAGQKVTVWYTAVDAAYLGTDQSTGCNSTTMSTLTNIGIR